MKRLSRIRALKWWWRSETRTQLLRNRSMLEDLIQALLGEFPEEWSLPHRILRQFEQIKAAVSLRQLHQLARDSVNSSVSRQDLPDEYQAIVKHGVSLIRATALRLFVEGKNPGGWSLFYGPEYVVWQCEKSQMENA